MENKKNLRFFVVMTYAAFYIMLGICVVIMACGIPMETISKYAPIVCAWASFLVLMIWAKKLLPDTSRKGFIRSLFRDRLELKWLVISAVIPAAMFAVIVSALGFIYKRPVNELFKTEFAAYPALFLTNLISGPIAEEPGWRGYYLGNSEKMRGHLKGTLTTGLFWGLWHAPLWFMEGYAPVNLIIYVFAFMIAIMSFNVLLSYIFSSHRNILYCVLMNQMFNFLGQLLNIKADEFIVYIILCAVFYFVTAVITVIVSKKRSQTMTPSSL